MAMIGSMGDVAFSVSSRTVRTLDSFQRSGDTGIGTHDIIGQKSETEYTGLPPEKVQFNILLRIDGGVSPAYELKKLRTMRDKGKVFPLIIGGRVIGKNYWIISSISENVPYWTPFGQIDTVSVSVSLQEYQTDALLMDSPFADVADQIAEVKDTVESKIEAFDNVASDLLGGMF